MTEFVILSAFVLFLFTLAAVFLLHHARKQEKEFKVRSGKE